MNLLFLGDIVGRAGRKAVLAELPGLIRELETDFVVINGENSAGGFGITEDIFNQLLDAGVDCVTLGNHAWDQREALVFIERAPQLLRPANFPDGTPGRGGYLYETRAGARVFVANVMGRLFMNPLDDPFAAMDRLLDSVVLGRDVDAIIVDVHAEATSEKQAMGYHLDGRVSLVIGTHTHVPTADHRILPEGTAYMSDAGMCGDYQSVIGMSHEEPVQRFLSQIPSGRFEPALGEATVSGALVKTDTTGRALSIDPIRRGGALSEI